jgi:glycosyltransferase involved in cell wall biosynthesis
MNICSPVPSGSGVEVLHRSLARGIAGYRLQTYSPWRSLFPPALMGLADRSADLVHASADYGTLFRRGSTPLVATLHNYTSDCFMRDYSSRLQYLHYRTDLRWLTRSTLERATVVVAISRFIGDLMTRDMWESELAARGLGSQPPMRLIYNGVDHKHFVPADTKFGAARFRVLFCGNLNRRKRAQLLPRLAAELGKGFEIHYTAGLSNDRLGGADDGSNVLCPLGRIEHADMPAVYQSMDALFMPSVREGFGLCVAEAMACGLPVVACRESALPELVVDDQGGLLCSVDDVSCYANSIRRLADDRVLARRMGEFNRARVEQLFTEVRMVDAYRSLFEEVLDGAFSR